MKVFYVVLVAFAINFFIIFLSCYDQLEPPVGVDPKPIKGKPNPNDPPDKTFLVNNDFKFEPYTVEFSLFNAFQLARCSTLAYNDEKNITSTLNKWGFTRTQYFNINDTKAFIAQSSHLIIIAFKGTSDITNALTDLDFAMQRTPLGKVHCGFNEAMDLVWDDLYTTLKKWQANSDGSAVWVTGHSLGAALATVATARLRLIYQEPVQGLYTFGSPRTFDSVYASKFNQNFVAQTFRFVNEQDIVTNVPLESLLNYRHVGRMQYIDHDKSISQSITFWHILMDALREKFMDWLGLFKLRFSMGGIENHFMEHYMDGIAKNLPADQYTVPKCYLYAQGPGCKN